MVMQPWQDGMDLVEVHSASSLKEIFDSVATSSSTSVSAPWKLRQTLVFGR